MVIILIRRYCKPDKLVDFIASYKAEKPEGKPGFLFERLTRLCEDRHVPDALVGGLPIKEGCINFVNVAFWNSWEEFQAAFTPGAGFFDKEIEAYPRERVVLDHVAGHGEPRDKGDE